MVVCKGLDKIDIKYKYLIIILIYINIYVIYLIITSIEVVEIDMPQVNTRLVYKKDSNFEVIFTSLHPTDR